MGKQPQKGQWNTTHRTPIFYTWAGDTFELLCIEHLPQIQNALRIASIDRNYCWSTRGDERLRVGATAGMSSGAQIDLLIESKSSRTDYVCEMKFTGGKYVITQQDEEDMLNKMDAFSASKMHNTTHSIQLVLVTTMGVAKGERSSIVNQTIVMDDLFK